MAIYQFKAEGLYCVANCFHHHVWERIKVDKNYNIEASFDPHTNIVTVDFVNHYLSEQQALDYLNKLDVVSFSKISKNNKKKYWLHGALALFIGLVLMLACMLGHSLPVLLSIAIIGTCANFYFGFSTFKRTIKAFFHGAPLSMDALLTVSTLASLLVSLAAFFIPGLPMMFEMGLLVYGFRQLGFAIEETIKEKIAVKKTFVQMTTVSVLHSKDRKIFAPILTSDVRENEYIRIVGNDIIPIDGIAKNDAWLLTAAEDGSYLPKLVKKGEQILAGSKLAPGSALELKTTSSLKKSALAQRDAYLAEQALPVACMPIADRIDKVLNFYIPAAFYLAFIATVILALFFPPALAIQCGIAVLLLACPCVIGLVIPLALKIGIQKAETHGIEFTNTQALQQAMKVDAIVFDLNGTLTCGKPVVSKTSLAKEVIPIVQAIEKYSLHPFAVAICADEPAYKMSFDVKVLPSQHHGGIKAEVNNEIWVIGNADFVKSENLSCPEISSAFTEHIIFAFQGEKYLGNIVITDSLRPGTAQIIKQLQNMGKEVFICTGAAANVAEAYAKNLNISSQNVIADCKALSKDALIKDLKKNNKVVAMVGDSDNDCFAMHSADFAIAIACDNGEKSRQEAGAIVNLSTPSLLPILKVFTIAKQTMSNIKQNLALSIIFNALTMVLPFVLIAGFGVAMPPAIGALLMIAGGIMVLANAYRFQQKKLAYNLVKTEENKNTIQQANLRCWQTPEPPHHYPPMFENNDVFSCAPNGYLPSAGMTTSSAGMKKSSTEPSGSHIL